MPTAEVFATRRFLRRLSIATVASPPHGGALLPPISSGRVFTSVFCRQRAQNPRTEPPDDASEQTLATRGRMADAQTPVAAGWLALSAEFPARADPWAARSAPSDFSGSRGPSTKMLIQILLRTAGRYDRRDMSAHGGTKNVQVSRTGRRGVPANSVRDMPRWIHGGRVPVSTRRTPETDHTGGLGRIAERQA